MLRSKLVEHLVNGARAAPWEVRTPWKTSFSAVNHTGKHELLDGGNRQLKSESEKSTAPVEDVSADQVAAVFRACKGLLVYCTLAIVFWSCFMSMGTSKHWHAGLLGLLAFVLVTFLLVFASRAHRFCLSSLYRLQIMLLLVLALAIFGMHVSLRFATITVSCVSILPVLGGVMGGGRLLALATCFALVVVFLCDRLRLVVMPDPLDFSANELMISNVMFEMLGASAAVWLFRRLLKRTEQLERESTDWGLMLARDIRTPMHGLLGLVDEFKGVELSPRDKELVQTLHGCARMMLAILDTMLGAPNVSVQPTAQNISLVELVAEIRHLAQSMAWRKSQTVDVELHASQPHALIRLRLSDFLQVLGNLVSNAVKFSPSGSLITIHVTTEHVHETSQCMLQFVVEDSGPGVPAALRQEIFKPFARGIAQASVEGVGLGLNIVREVLTAMDGTIECRERCNGLSGARFIVRIPCALPATLVSDQALGLTSAGKVASNMVHGAFGRVLLVDDNALNLLLLCRFLEQLGVERENIVTASSGEAALTRVELDDVPFAAAILDMVLPGIDGVELARRLKPLHMKKFPDSPPLVLVGASASLTPAVHEAWMRAGVSCQFTKPFQKAAVAEMLTFVRDCQRDQCDRDQTLNKSDPASTISMGPSTPVKTARMELQMEILTLNIGLLVGRAVASALTGSLLDPRHVSRFVLLLAAIILRISVRRYPNIVRAGIVATVYLYMASKISLTGCGSFVGYLYVPLIAGLVYGASAVSASFAACISTHSLLLCLNYFAVAPKIICHQASPTDLLISDTVGVTLGAAGCILIYLSLMTLVQDTRIRWTNTLSHDLRAPLHGVFASISDLQESDALSIDSCRAVRTMKTCANSLLAVTDTVLAMAVSTAPLKAVLRLEDLKVDLRDIAGMAIDQELIGDVSLDDGAADLSVLCERSALTYALSQLVAAVPLLTSPSAIIDFFISFETDTTLRISAQELGRPPSKNAHIRDPSELGDSAPAVWGQHRGQSTLVRVVHSLLLGEVELLVDDALADQCNPWLLSIRIPVTREKFSSMNVDTIGNDSVSIRTVALIDDSTLNLRIGERLLTRCGVDRLRSFVSSAEAVSTIESGLLNDVEVFLIDLNMPLVSGVEVARRTAEHFSRESLLVCPVLIACTSDATVATHDAAIQAGMHHVLVKPFGEKDLMRMLSFAFNVRTQMARSDASSEPLHAHGKLAHLSEEDDNAAIGENQADPREA